MPTLVTLKETSRYKIKVYKISKRLILLDNDDTIFFVTIRDNRVDNYVQIPQGLPELEKILKELKENVA